MAAEFYYISSRNYHALKKLQPVKLIQKYITVSFLKPFLLGLGAFVLLMTVTHFFDFLHTFLDYKPALSLLVSYFLNRIPEWLVTVTPVATLLAVLFSLGALKRHGELTAIGSSGISSLKILKPLVIISVLVSIISFAVSETLVPGANARADELWNVMRNKEIPEADKVRENFTYIAGKNRFYFIEKFSGRTISGLKIIEFFPHTTKEKSRLSALKAVYSQGSWYLRHGTQRTFSADNSKPISYMEFKELKYDIPETPEDFARVKKTPENMGFFSLLKYIQRLEKGGMSTRKHRVVLHHKISFSFSNTIILILGIPLALWGGMKNRTAGFFIALLVSFIYWGAITVSKALGTGAVLQPVIAAWSANILFLIISLVMMKKIRIF